MRVALASAFVLTWLNPVLHLLTAATPWPLRILGAPWVVLPLLVLARQAVADTRHTVE